MKYVTYYRVSTHKQGIAGLGMEAQQEAVKRFLQPGDEVLASYTEVESGRRNRRPQLDLAVAACEAAHATLLIAKLDRLSRNVAFIATLMENKKVQFKACDNPHAQPLMMHMLAAFAEHEAKMISDRTKAALAAAKARGVKLGGDRGYKPDNTVAKKEADDRAAVILPYIRQLQASGVKTLAALAEALNQRGVRTSRGAHWTSVQVRRVLLRGRGSNTSTPSTEVQTAGT